VDLQDNVTEDTKGIEIKWDLQENVTEDTEGIEIKWICRIMDTKGSEVGSAK